MIAVKFAPKSFLRVLQQSLFELSGPVLRDTARLSQRYPLIARYGVFGVSTWPIGCDTPSPFSERFPVGEHAKWRCDSPPQKGYLSDTCAIPCNKKKAKSVRYPSAILSERVLRDMGGGISCWAAKFLNPPKYKKGPCSIKGGLVKGWFWRMCLYPPSQGKGTFATCFCPS